MQKFYFNECIPHGSNINSFNELFCNTLTSFDELSKKHSFIEKAVVTEKLPSDISIGQIGTLHEIINKIDNKDLRNVAFSYFNRYPIGEHFDLEEEAIDEILEKNFIVEFNGKEIDAMNLAMVGLNNGFLFTTATHPSLQENLIYPTPKNSGQSIQIFNLHGDRSLKDTPDLQQPNTLFIENKVIENEISNKNLFEQLIAVLGNCVYSTNFEREFYKLRVIEQTSVIDEFKKAKERNLASPFYPDTKIIKDVTPDQSNKCSIYELRVYTPTAIRIYFSETKGKVFVSKIGYKASPDQSTEIRNAQSTLNKMILTV